MAYLLAESISRELQPHQVVVKDEKGARVETVLEPPRGASLVAWLRGMASLLVSEGERRRVRVELESAEQVDPREEAAIAHIEQFRRKYASSDE